MMASTATPAVTGPDQVGQPQLKRNTVDWRHVAILSVAGCGPAATIALNIPFMGQFAGAALVLAFVLIWPAVLILVNSFAEFARRLPTAGGLYTWNARAWGSSIGFVYGWTFMGAYLLVAAGGFTIFGGFMSEYLQSQFSLDVPWWIFTVAGLVYVAVLGLLGIVQTLHATLALLTFEVVLLIGLAIWMLLSVGPGEWSTVPFRPSAIQSGGASALGLAMTFAVLSHVGIEEGATLGEEAKQPKRNIPKGLWATAILVPTFYVFVSYALVQGYGVADIQGAFAEDAVPIQTVAEKYWGAFGLAIIVFAAALSILAFAQTSFNAGCRVVYTLGRERVLSSWLAGVSHRGTPHTAIFAMVAACLVMSVPFAIAVGPFETWGYYGFLIGIAFLVSYVVTNLALIRWTRRIGEFRLMRHGILPAVGAAIMCYPLYRSVFPLQDGIYGALPFVYLGWIALGTVLLFHARRRRPEMVERIGSALAAAEADEVASHLHAHEHEGGVAPVTAPAPSTLT